MKLNALFFTINIFTKVILRILGILLFDLCRAKQASAASAAAGSALPPWELFHPHSSKQPDTEGLFALLTLKTFGFGEAKFRLR